MRTIILLTAFLLLCITTSNAQSAYYKVKFPDDQTIIGCYEYPDTIWPEITKYSDCNFNIGVSVKDQVFNLNAWGGCKKILRTWTLLHWCTYDPNETWPVYIQNPPDSDIGATVFGVPSNRGHISYTQIIKVVDKEAPIFVNCPTDPLVFCDYTGNDATQYNDGHYDKCEGPADLGIKVTDLCSEDDILLTYRLFLDMDGNGSMETYLSSSSPNAWPINKMSLSGDTLMANIAFPPGHGFPYAKHKIEWIANDKCGNESICKYEFTVKDCKAPTVVCLNGLSINIMQTGMITLWDSDFIQYASDNCTPANQLKFGIRKAGTGVGFPVDSHSVTFDCTELGSQEVEIWSVDAYGNADYCITYVIVQDNMGSCPPSKPFFATVTTADQKPVPGVQVTLKKGAATLATSITDANGQYSIGSVPASCNYKLTPTFDGDATNGINTLDALLVAGHTDAILPLATPYKLLAADVDKSGSLTDADIMSIVKMALGLKTTFPVNKVWQFIPASHVFPDPGKPWSNSIPASLTFCLSGPMQTPQANFVGIKYGDINGSADPNGFAPTTEDRAKDNKAIFTAVDQVFTAGQEVRVDIITPDLAGLTAFQFTLDYDVFKLSSVKIEPDLVGAEFTGIPQEGRLTASWYSSIMLDPTVIGKNLRLRTFTLVFTALQNGTLSEALHMSSAITKAEAYNRKLQPLNAELRYQPVPVGTNLGLNLLPVRPNPVTDRFTAAYYLPEAGTTTLTLTDATGRVLHASESYQERGYHETILQLDGTVKPGLLFLRLEGPGGTDVQRAVKQ